MLEPWLQQRLGVAVRRMAPLAGGSIHRSWRLDLVDGSRAFLKTNRHAALAWLEAEVEGLEALAAVALPRCRCRSRWPVRGSATSRCCC